MSFGWPIALVGLVVVPLLLGAYVRHERRRPRAAAQFGNPALLPNVVERAPGRLRHLPLVLALLALTVMVVGVARPHAMVSEPREEATVVLAIDVSRSMEANDVHPTRLDAARVAAKAFLAKVPAKFRVGVVSFATRAVVAVPPTQDRSLVSAALDSLSPGEGTAIGDAIALSLRLGQKQRAADGTVPPETVLMISDGARDGGTVSPQDAAARARKQKVPIYTVLVGTPDGIVRATLPGGLQQIIRVPANPETLSQIAQGSGGRFFTTPNEEQLKQVYEQLGSRLGRTRVSREVTDYFAGAAAALLLVGGTLSALMFRRIL